ncbi:hypothetical protein DEO72_LG6g1578 [Vigna unguiculata]|uniref:Uncharacterized protein n=1 Tax=Vigna unguiculata TaxID=3917 RepID=A0A4D6M8N5_VIGUN|nr:hypothetical protein DEO72_LG6g1578 [Vigna unguiculata]
MKKASLNVKHLANKHDRKILKEYQKLTIQKVKDEVKMKVDSKAKVDVNTIGEAKTKDETYTLAQVEDIVVTNHVQDLQLFDAPSSKSQGSTLIPMILVRVTSTNILDLIQLAIQETIKEQHKRLYLN